MPVCQLFGGYKFYAIMADIGQSRVRMTLLRAENSGILNPSQNALRRLEIELKKLKFHEIQYCFLRRYIMV